jgi:hypothetical protein
MNRVFDYNGTMVSPSKPTGKLTTLRRVVHLDSGDRDIRHYPTNGDIVLYLPRVYEKVVGIRVKGAEFPAINPPSLTGTFAPYAQYTLLGPNGMPFVPNPPGFYVRDFGATGPNSDYPLNNVKSIFLDIEHLNRSDETAPLHQRSSFTDSTFAKFQTNPNPYEATISNESSSMHNETYYTPPIGKLDRLRIMMRTHDQKASAKVTGLTGGPGYIYSSGGTFGASGQEYGLTLEIITLENSFDEFSSMETRLTEKQAGFWGSN